MGIVQRKLHKATTRGAPGVRHRHAAQRGAAAVEFAFAMLFLCFFFIAFTQIVQVFLAHERLGYAAFLAGRAYQVHGSPSRAASAVEKNYSLKTESTAVLLEKRIPVPIDFNNPFTRNAIRETGTTMRIAKRVPVFLEPGNLTGDN